MCKAYNIMGIPRFMIFDAEGRIIDINAERPSALGLRSCLMAV